MDARTGDVLWRYPLGASVRNSIAIEGGKVLAQDVHGQLVCRRCGNGNGKLEKGSGDRRCASAQRRACGLTGSGICRHGQDAVGILHRQPSVNGRNQSACGRRHCLRGCLGRRNLCPGCSQGGHSCGNMRQGCPCSRRWLFRATACMRPTFRATCMDLPVSEPTTDFLFFGCCGDDAPGFLRAGGCGPHACRFPWC